VLLFPIIEKDRELNKFKMSRVNMGLVSHHCHIHCLYTNAKLHPGVLLSNLFQCHLCLRVFMAGGPDLLPTFGASRRESTSYMLQPNHHGPRLNRIRSSCYPSTTRPSYRRRCPYPIVVPCTEATSISDHCALNSCHRFPSRVQRNSTASAAMVADS
jgi:hypothetical protein